MILYRSVHTGRRSLSRADARTALDQLRDIPIVNRVIAVIVHTIASAVGSARIGCGVVVHAIADCAETVTIPIGLAGVGGDDAVVADIANAVSVRIGLAGVGDVGAVVAGIAHAIGVRILLAGVDDRRAVVGSVWHAVAIRVGGISQASPVPS